MLLLSFVGKSRRSDVWLFMINVLFPPINTIHRASAAVSEFFDAWDKKSQSVSNQQQNCVPI